MEARGLVVGVAGTISSVNSDVRRNFRRRYNQFCAEMTDPNGGGCGESGGKGYSVFSKRFCWTGIFPGIICVYPPFCVRFIGLHDWFPFCV